MLKQRVLTAIVLLLILVGAIFGFSALLFEAFIALVIALAAWEWSALVGWNKFLPRMLYTSLILLGLCFGRNVSMTTFNFILILNLLWWLLSFAFIYFYPKYSKLWESRIFVGLVGFIILYPCWLSLVYLRRQPEFIFTIFMLFGIVAAADIGAYFSGRKFGKHKLAAQVSPGKTWEGVWGGMLACCVLMLCAAVLNGKIEMTLSAYLCLLVSGIALAASSVVGDLLESMLKRIRGVKDSGTILPGHGGILDRIDGVLATVPLYTFLFVSFGSYLQ